MHGKSFAAVSLTWVSHVAAVLAPALAVATKQIPATTHSGTNRIERCGMKPSPRELGNAFARCYETARSSAEIADPVEALPGPARAAV
jgi:hypothetical protein